MLTTARPIFEHVPAAFADPTGLADQQAHGVVSLVVVRYDAERPDRSAESAQEASPPSPTPGERSERPHPFPTYDTFVAVSGQLLAVARTTPDYRFPVTPASALARFLAHRNADHTAAGDGPTLSLYAVGDDDCARFLETAFYAECLKLHVDGPASAPLVAAQLARATGCTSSGRWPSGVLELNDFSDPAAPHVALLDLADVAPTDGDPDALADALAPHLDGVAGRVLLYDREKNRATLPDRTGHGFDLSAAIEQANRLADARRDARDRPAPEPEAERPPDPAEAALLARTAPPADTSPEPVPDPAAARLGALVAELQGAGPAPLADDLDAPTLLDTEPSAPTTSAGAQAETERTRPVEAALDNAPSSPIPDEQSQSSPSPAAQPPPHPLAVDLDRLRADVVALFEDAVGRDRAQAHHTHVVETLGLSVPVPPGRTVEYLRALLTADPPRRWHLFKRARGRVAAQATDRLLAFHAAHAHADSPAVQEVAQLWTRLHR